MMRNWSGLIIDTDSNGHVGESYGFLISQEDDPKHLLRSYFHSYQIYHQGQWLKNKYIFLVYFK